MMAMDCAAPGTSLVRVVRADADALAIPLVLDSPHSGTHYPPDFRAAQPIASLRTAEDTHVDLLFSQAPKMGASLICAEFPRSYVDCNRLTTDIDERLLATAWPDRVSASEKTHLGYGLIWRRLDDGSAIYNRLLSVAEVEARIARCYLPYWRALREEVSLMRTHFGQVYHLNCHSMPHSATHASHLPIGTVHADIVLGDRDGTTADPEFMACIETAFQQTGLRVKRNDPYKGVALIQAFGTPAAHSHSVQIEINRALYMDECTREPNADFRATQNAIDNMLSQIAAWIKCRTA
jgi:N-formylglutamate deformylase